MPARPTPIGSIGSNVSITFARTTSTCRSGALFVKALNLFSIDAFARTVPPATGGIHFSPLDLQFLSKALGSSLMIIARFFMISEREYNKGKDLPFAQPSSRLS